MPLGSGARIQRHFERRKKGVTARLRAAKSRKLKAVERERMQEVRERENHKCRFPHECGRPIEVSHQTHRGMGGDPTGEATRPEIMVGVCGPIHRTGRYAIDKKNLRWFPVSPEKGANGPIGWEIDVSAFPRDDEHFWVHTLARENGTIIVAVEQSPGVYYLPFPLTHRLLALINKGS